MMAMLAVVMIWNSAWAMGPVQEGGVKGLSERVAQVESALEKVGVTLSGTIEVEAAYADDDREAGDTSDITLSKVELGVDVNPVKHASGHALFLFEEDDTEQVEVDEGFIRLDGEDKLPLFLQAGRQLSERATIFRAQTVSMWMRGTPSPIRFQVWRRLYRRTIRKNCFRNSNT